jgi:hypothetical protein
MKNMISIIVSLCTLVALAFGAYFTIDKTYARDTKVEKIYQFAQTTDKSLRLKVEGDVLNSQQQNYWNWENQYGPNAEKTKDPMIKEKMYQMKKEISVQDKKVQQLRDSLGVQY